MKSYPYIGRGEYSGSIVLMLGEDKCIDIDSEIWAGKNDSLECGINESNLKNITPEYLEGKCVKINSPEHGEFIINICESNGIAVAKKHLNRAFIVFCGGGMLFCDAPHNSYKQITIPLPPKTEPKHKEWPQVGDEVSTIYGLGEVVSNKDKDGYYRVRFNVQYLLITIDAIKKPKAEAEILRDELHECITDYSSSESLINDLINKFNITKKV